MAYLDTLYRQHFIEYASYVVKERAIPCVEDGLKPVQRRILHSLFEVDDGKFHKVANIVGHTMKYHPHGDQSIPASLVVLANKDLFIDKQGNFGNIHTGDEAAAARYIECRLTPLAREVLFHPELTPYQDSYDGRNREPLLFPARIPVLLAQGAEGIAVGMSTRILPHNLIELLEAEIACLEEREFHLLPDFPTGGLMDASGYEDGRGKVLVRARLDTSDPKRIVIGEIPFGTTTQSLIASIEEAAKKGKIKIASIHDFTAEKVEIEIKLMRGVYADEVVEALYAFTDCEVSISSHLLLICGGRPQMMSVTEVVRHNLERLVDILKAELRLEERKLHHRLYTGTLEQIFIEKRLYQAIEAMKTPAQVKAAVLRAMKPFAGRIGRALDDEDLEHLLEIPIRRLALYDIDKAAKEMERIRERLRRIATQLEHIEAHTLEFLQSLIRRYRRQFPRRTELACFEKADVRAAAQRNLRLRYNRSSGYLGHEIDGQTLFEVSQYDRVLVVRKDGSYSVVEAPDKLFVGKGMLHCGFVDRELIFNMVYRDPRGFACIKRCRIEQFILNRIYSLVPAEGKLLKLSTDSGRKIQLDYKPGPRRRKLQEQFAIGDYPVRGRRAGGVRLAARELKGCRIL